MKLSSPVGCQLSLSFPSFSAFLGLFLLAMLSTWVCIVVGDPNQWVLVYFPFSRRSNREVRLLLIHTHLRFDELAWLIGGDAQWPHACNYIGRHRSTPVVMASNRIAMASSRTQLERFETFLGSHV